MHRLAAEILSLQLIMREEISKVNLINILSCLQTTRLAVEQSQFCQVVGRGWAQHIHKCIGFKPKDQSL